MADKESEDSHKSTRKSLDENETHSGWKSKWVESTSPRTDDPVKEEEMRGHNLLGNESPTDGDEETA